MILTVEYRGQDHQVFVPDNLYDFLKTGNYKLWQWYNLGKISEVAKFTQTTPLHYKV